MSILLSAIETIGTLTAAGYAAHRVENVFLARKGYDTRNFFKPIADEPTKAIDLTWAQWCDRAEAEEERLWRQCPTAWWLDPERWGPRPSKKSSHDGPVGYGRTRITASLVHHYEAEPDAVNAPPCPACKIGRRMVMAVHDGEATMWDCFDCGCEFTRAGETKKSRKARLARESVAKAAEDAKRLPCGCSGEVTTRSYPSAGFDMGRYAVCETCGGCWDYAARMDDEGNPRKMHSRSGPVEWPNGNKLK